MRWDSIFDGFHSLWDAEEDNAELDERREIMRADRASQPFISVVNNRSRAGAIMIGLDGSRDPIHVTRVGAGWMEGKVCGSGNLTIVPLAAVQWCASEGPCGCHRAPAQVVEHVTLGARLRAIERAGVIVSVVNRNGGHNGRITAVWRDALDLLREDHTVSVSLSNTLYIVVDGA